MDTSFYSFNIRTNKDLIIARQRTRHIARLLNFEPRDQAAIAATVFTLARGCLTEAGRLKLQFHIRRNTLQIVPETPEPECLPFDASARWNTWRLEKPLPQADSTMSLEDLSWAMETMSEFAPASIFDEIAQQNEDMLNLLRELAELRQQQHVAAA